LKPVAYKNQLQEYEYLSCITRNPQESHVAGSNFQQFGTESASRVDSSCKQMFAQGIELMGYDGEQSYPPNLTKT
jgi:hypothetical protein